MIRRGGRWAAEFILIVIGVLAALAVDDWRQRRTDRALEQHLLTGIAADVSRDLQDIRSGIGGAKARLAGTDELLAMLGEPDAGAVRIPPIEGGVSIGGTGIPQLLTRDYSGMLSEARQTWPHGSASAQEALLMATLMLRFDLADATYSEATASGQVDVIQDLDLRSEIGQYYFDARRFGPTVDERVEASVSRLVSALSAVGLSQAARAEDDAVLSALRTSPEAIAELKTVRYWAAFQMERHTYIEQLAIVLSERLARAGAPIRSGD